MKELTVKAKFIAAVRFCFNPQAKAVNIIVVAIGPEAQKPKNRQVIDFIGGKKLFLVDDYASIGNAIQDITKLTCRKCDLTDNVKFEDMIDHHGYIHAAVKFKPKKFSR